MSGVGWVPTNTMISALSVIGDTPFGATGDLILVPDATTEAHVDFDDGSAPEHFLLGDIRHTDGKPWECCPREFLRRGLAALKEAAGLELFASFEHEFVYTGVEDMPGAPYSLDAWRRQGIFGEVLVAAIRKAGVDPDTFLPEYAKRQYEVTVAPSIGIKAADDAVKLREMARAAHSASATARSSRRSSIRMARAAASTSISASRISRVARRCTIRPAPYGLSPVAQSFMAGVVKHLPAICAVTAPSPVSYFRLRPNRWAPTWAYVADRDREACLRICPVLDLPDIDPARRSSMSSIARPTRRRAPISRSARWCMPASTASATSSALAEPRNVAAMSEKERKAAGIRHLPQSLAEALDNLEATPEAKDWFGPIYLDAYLRHKRAEVKMVAEMSEQEQCDALREELLGRRGHLFSLRGEGAG